MSWLLLCLLLSACAVGEEEAGPPLGPPPADNFRGEEAVITAAHFGGPYLGVESYNIDCLMNGDWLSLDAEKLDTKRPVLPARDPNAPCDPVEEDDTTWMLHCRQMVISGWPFPDYWDDFTIILDKSDWQGYFYWYVDGLEYFHCTYTFEVTEVEFTYDWR